MFPSRHLIFGILFASVLFFFFPNIGFVGFLLIVLSTFFIDVDHYLLYVWMKKDISLRNAYNFFVKKHYEFVSFSKERKKNLKYGILIFHGIEFWLILGLLSIFSDIFLYILIGIMFHIFLDWIALIYYETPIYCKFSQTYTFIKNKNLPK